MPQNATTHSEAAAGRGDVRPAMQFTTIAGDGAPCLAALSADAVVLSRDVGGLACRIRLGADHFRGVAVVDRDGQGIVRLLHPDLALTLDLSAAVSVEEAEGIAEDVAALTGLPTLLMGGTGRFWLSSAEDPLAGEAAERRLSLAAPRRPRFLARRRPGRPTGASRVAGRELAAPSC